MARAGFESPVLFGELVTSELCASAQVNYFRRTVLAQATRVGLFDFAFPPENPTCCCCAEIDILLIKRLLIVAISRLTYS